MSRYLALLASALVLALPGAAPAAERPKFVIENTRAVGITTTVTAIDFDKRVVTLTDPDGRRAVFRAGPAIGNLEQVRAGDTVAASYTLREVISVYPRGARPVVAARSASIETTQFAATVEAVDRDGRTVLLRGPGGRVAEIVIAPEAQSFDRLEKGDRVVYRGTAVLTMLGAGPVPGTLKAGLLACDLSPSVGFIVGSFQNLRCRFTPDVGGPGETYTGSIGRIGLDIGITGGGQLAWAVYAPSALGPGALAGSYTGASGQAALGVGFGANLLLGGSRDTVALQPLSVEGRIGLNLALGVANLTLTPGP